MLNIVCHLNICVKMNKCLEGVIVLKGIYFQGYDVLLAS